MVFRGINVVSLDVKGRIVIPSRYRETLVEKEEGKVILTIDTEENCLLLYPISIWIGIEDKIGALPSFNPFTRRIQRLLIGHATELVLDNNGRLLLPSLLREYAKIDKQAILVGQGKKFELWDKELWENSREKWLTKGGDSQGILPENLQTLSL